MGWMLPMRCEASQLQRLQKQELRTGGRGPVYTLSNIKIDSCGLCRLSKIAHTRPPEWPVQGARPSCRAVDTQALALATGRLVQAALHGGGRFIAVSLGMHENEIRGD